MKVAYPGREGAHSAAACALLFPEEDAQALPSFSDVVAAVASGRVEAGVLPIESSISGPVAETHDLLVDSATSINEQAILPIRHFLVGVAEVPLPEIRVVRSHPVALDQCRRLLASLPEAEAIAAGTTADAAAQVARDADPTEVAIASERAAALHGLVVLAADVGDHPEAFTRFVAISNRTQLGDGADWRIAFSFQTDHRPGALHRAIEPFARHALDLVQLTSRPIPQTPWRYRFDAVVAGHPLDPVVCETLAEVRRQAQRFTVFGSYPSLGVGVARGLPARVVPADQVRVDAAGLGEVERQQLERDDVDDRVARRHERDVAAEQLERGGGLGGARGRAALALEHEAAHGLVDRGEVAVQELLEQVRLRRDVDALAQLQRRLLRGRPVAAGAGDHEALVLRDGQPLAGEPLGDGVRQPRDVLAAQRRERRDGAGVGGRVAVALLDLGRRDDHLVAERRRSAPPAWRSRATSARRTPARPRASAASRPRG